jgi:nucleotide-binding universal stress UspA family protein
MSSMESRAQTSQAADPLELDGLGGRPVIVGVDGSERNASAIRWATVEAARSGRPLVLILAVEHEPSIPHFSAAAHEPVAKGVFETVEQQIQAAEMNLTVAKRAVTGQPDDVLVEAARHGEITVLGRRGRGTFARLIVGSTSIAVAGRALGPVVIVPDQWAVAAPHHRPIVVGIDVEEPDRIALEFAYARAATLGVDLVAVHANEAPWVYDPLLALEATEDRIANRKKLMFEALRPQAKAYPQVTCRLEVREEHPAQAVVDEAARAGTQLVVLGARRQRRMSGFPLGSVTRAVLHHAGCPVAVVRAREGHH